MPPACHHTFAHTQTAGFLCWLQSVAPLPVLSHWAEKVIFRAVGVDDMYKEERKSRKWLEEISLYAVTSGGPSVRYVITSASPSLHRP